MPRSSLSRSASLLRLFAAACALATALVSAPAARAAPHDQLVIGITQFPSTFHPSIDAMLAKSYIMGMTERPFTVYDAHWHLVCMLCTKLPTIENGGAHIEDLPPDKVTKDRKKGIAVTYTIRPDATWGDGVPVTTKDVVFTWKVGKNPLSGISNSEMYKRILSIDVKDDKTFTLHLDRVSFDYNAINDFNVLPAHLEEKAFHDPANYRRRTLFDTDPTNPGLYFGPYRIVKVVPGSYVVLEPNPTWWGRKPAFRRIVVRVIENTAALEANLLSGAIDYIAGELGLSLEQALQFEKRYGNRFKVIFKPGLNYEHLCPNLDNPILADVRVRRALLLAVDRKGISEELFSGKQPVADAFVSPLDWVYTPDVMKYPYDPAAAAKLLEEAGWTMGKDGIRVNAAGKPLRLMLQTTAGNRTRELVEQVLASQWRKVGIDVHIRNEPARVFFGQTVSRRLFPGLAMFAWVSSPENVPRSTLYSDQIPSAKNGYAGQNYEGYRNPKVDKLIDAIEVELDRKKRAELWHRLQRIYAEDLPELPLYFRAEAYILPHWLKGIVPTGHQYPSTLWVEDWRAEDRGSAP